jgi:subtilisin family serine protease
VLAGGVDRIWLDRKVRANLDRSVPQIGAPAAWSSGYDGTGVTVAVLDTGIDAGHPDLTGTLAEAKNFTPNPDTGDHFGHGTHVAPRLDGVTVWASYDDGGSWREVTVSDDGGGRYAVQLQHPPLDRTTGYVSLRVRATDRDGGAIEQTVMRAFGLK